MTTPPTIAALAGSLTGAQRRRVCEIATSNGCSLNEAISFCQPALFNAKPLGNLWKLSPLGQQVAAFLVEQQK